MKKALVTVPGYVSQIVDPGEDFEIYEGEDAQFVWVDAPDDITVDWTLEYSPSAGAMVWVKRDKAYTDPEIARKVAYGDIGAQLDMQYKDSLDGGTRWVDHVSAVKTSIPKPVARPTAMTLEEMKDFSENEEPGVDKPLGLSFDDTPAWVRYPGWKGYKPTLAEEVEETTD